MITGELPLEGAMKIQEALLPLGYMVLGYDESSKFGIATIHLGIYDPTFRKSPNNPSEISNVGMDEPDNGLHGTE
ncbi:MAG: hypothetical protein LBK73_08770 [Treponema sp.]|jgi:hypothetical protein|nr:hypothetical protein [Treponema sp.]